MISTLVQSHPVHAMGAGNLPTVHSRVGIWVDTTTRAGQDIVQGILSYVRANTTWRISLPELVRTNEERNQRPAGDGVLVQLNDAVQADRAAQLGVPAINVNGEFAAEGIPSVSTDYQAVAQLALDHFVSLGFRRVAVGCWMGKPTGQNIAKCCASLAKASDIDVGIIECDSDRAWEETRDSVVVWVQRLPEKTAILATDDSLGQLILDACCAAGRQVPSDLAVLGVGNDELICGIAEPPMSSIELDNRRTGYEAARRLHQMLERGIRGNGGLRIPPIQIVARRSTDQMVVDDPEVGAAARFIREHALDGIKVADVLSAVPLSRRVLETRFRNQFGRTLHQEILSVQLENIKELLRSTDLSMFQIASRSGFRHVEYMSVVFKREIGTTPSEYRRQWREER